MAGRDRWFRRAAAASSLVGLLAWASVGAADAADVVAAAATVRASAEDEGKAAAVSQPLAARLDAPGRPVELVPCAARGTGRVSASDRMTADLLAMGRSRSVTFDRLVSAIEQSDVVVVVMTGRVSRAGQLAFATATPYGRIVRATLTVPEITDRLVPTLAHELQHALEMASDCTVVSQATMEQFYRDYGHRVAEGTFCTLAAQEVTKTVAHEIGTSRTRH